MTIRVLPESIASAIAAGEVVERPVSVVKELVENSLDAGATSVSVRLEAGGRKLIEVVDNGEGIPASDVPLSVARFATSKLETMDDLFAVKSLGFRGEALSSIAAVSRLEILTRALGEEMGTRLLVEGGTAARPEGIGAPRGTIVRVRDLFFNVPARRKFLKTDRTERGRVSEMLTQYAVAYPAVQFELTQEGRTQLQTSGSGDRREALAAVHGVELAREMIALPTQADSPIQIEGFVSPPSVHRSNRRQITFFVNGRWIQDASLGASVGQAYHSLLMVGRFPVAVVIIRLPPEEVDVNVHPAKAEVRFREPNLVFSFVQRVIRSTLLGQAPSPHFQFGADWMASPSTVGSEGWPVRDGDLPGEAGVEVQEAASGLSQTAFTHPELPLLRAVGQVGSSYLVAEGPDGIYLVDQHAAHERVLFEAIMSAHRSGSLEAQRLIAPALVELSASQADLLDENREAMRALGFEIEDFGGHVYRVRSIPDLLKDLDPGRALMAVVEDFEEDERPLNEELEARLAARVCKRAAVRAGQILSLEEQERLLRELEQCQAPRTCPHGRPTMIHLSVQALERQFGRRG